MNGSLRLRKSLCVLGVLFALTASSLAADRPRSGNSSVLDWSSHYVVRPRPKTLAATLQAQRDPRGRAATLRRGGPSLAAFGKLVFLPPPVPAPKIQPIPVTPHRDWSYSLGNGTVAAGQYPAKFAIDPIEDPDCTNDYVVYSLNVLGAVGQANLVGLNNLYSNSDGSGFCSGTAPATYWAYRITARLATSPAISEDGTKIAFVENSNPPKFHVLAWKSGQGTVTAPKAPTLIVGAPTAGSGAMSALALSPSTASTLGSPYIDYDNDVAYVSTDQGRIYRIRNVFCVTAACINSPAAPSLDPAWGVNPVTITGNPRLTAVVMDSNTGNLFVGGSDGKLYALRAADGSTLTGSPITVGDGTSVGGVNVGGITDPPILDGFDGYVYGFTGSGNGVNALVVQATTTFSSSVSVTVGPGGKLRLHDGAFNDAYYSQSQNGNPLQWFLYVCGTDAVAPANDVPTLHRIDFSNARVMQTDSQVYNLGVSGDDCSPFTEILTVVNADRLFWGLLGVSNLVEETDLSINGDLNPPIPSDVATPAPEPGGSSGIIVDGLADPGFFPEASSIYFANQAKSNNCGTNVFCAVKLTQLDLQ